MPDEPKVWLRRFRDASNEMKPHAERWERMHRLSAGNMFRTDFGDEAMPVNLLSNYVRVVLPHLLPRDATLGVVVHPKKPGPEYATSADLLADRCKAWARQVRLIEPIRRAVRASLYAIGYLKVGLEAKTGIVARAPREGEFDPDAAAEVVDVDRQRVGGAEFMDAGLPFCAWVPPRRLLVEPGATVLDEAGWIAERLFRRLSFVRVDPRFAKYADRLRATHTRTPRSIQDEESATQEGRDEREGVVELYEVHDRDAGRVLYLGGDGCGCDEVLFERPWTEGIEGYPFVDIAFDRPEGYLYPNPPIGPLFDLATSVDVLAAAMTVAVRQSKTIIMYDPKEIKDDVAASIANAEQGQVIPVPGLSQHVQVVQFGSVPADTYEVIARLKGLFDEMSGIGEFRRGVSANSPRATATEVQAAMMASGVTLDDMRGAVMTAIGRVFRLAGAIMHANQELLADIQLPLTGGDQRDFRMIAMGGQGVIGEVLDYAYETVPVTEDPVEPAILQKRLQELIGQAVNPAIQQGLNAEGRQLLLGPLLERYFRSLGETDVDRFLTQAQPPVGPDPNQSEQARAEDAQMLQTGIPHPVAPTDDHPAHLEVHVTTVQQTGSEAIAAHIAMHEQLALSVGVGPPPPTNSGAMPFMPGPPSVQTQPGQSPQAGIGAGQDEMAALRRAAG